MKKAIPLALLLLVVTVPAWSQWWEGGRRDRVPNLNGTWYLNGDEEQPCEIRQRRPDGRALFINENGSRAWGTVRGDRVWIPDWTDGESNGLRGRIRGNRIIWPNGTFWSR
jgi:hypothetical protein